MSDEIRKVVVSITLNTNGPNMIPASKYPNRFGNPSLRIIIANTTPTKIIIAKLNNITLSPYIEKNADARNKKKLQELSALIAV